MHKVQVNTENTKPAQKKVVLTGHNLNNVDWAIKFSEKKTFLHQNILCRIFFAVAIIIALSCAMIVL